MHRTADRTPIAGIRSRVDPGRRTGLTRLRGRRLIAAFAIAAVTLATPLVAAPQPAFAADYPSWDEVEAAKANTAAGAAAVTQIVALIAQLEANVETTRAEAERRTDELFVAQQKYDEAVQRANQIQAQADASAAEAQAAEQNAGQVAATAGWGGATTGTTSAAARIATTATRRCIVRGRAAARAPPGTGLVRARPAGVRSAVRYIIPRPRGLGSPRSSTLGSGTGSPTIGAESAHSGHFERMSADAAWRAPRHPRPSFCHLRRLHVCLAVGGRDPGNALRPHRLVA